MKNNISTRRNGSAQSPTAQPPSLVTPHLVKLMQDFNKLSSEIDAAFTMLHFLTEHPKRIGGYEGGPSEQAFADGLTALAGGTMDRMINSRDSLWKSLEPLFNNQPGIQPGIAL